MRDTRYFNQKGQIFYRAADGTWSDFSRAAFNGMSDRAMAEEFGPLTLDGEVGDNSSISPIGHVRGSSQAESPVATVAQSSARREAATRCDRSDLCELSGELGEQLAGILVWWNGLSADVRHLVERTSLKSSKAEYYPNWPRVSALLDACAAAKAPTDRRPH